MKKVKKKKKKGKKKEKQKKQKFFLANRTHSNNQLQWA